MALITKTNGAGEIVAKNYFRVIKKSGKYPSASHNFVCNDRAKNREMQIA